MLEGIASGLAPALGWTTAAFAADRLCLRLRGFAPLGDEPQALVWLCVLSLFTRIGLESLRFDAWTWAGFPPNELVRYACMGWLFAAELPLWVAVHGLVAKRRTAALGPVGRGLLATAGAALLATAFSLPTEAGWSASAAIVGAWLLIEAWSGEPAAFSYAWAMTAVALLVVGEAAQPLLAARRFYNVGFDDPHLFDAPLRLAPALACGPLAMLAAYRRAASTLGLPLVAESKDCIKTASGL